jgi:hypothetical protein
LEAKKSRAVDLSLEDDAYVTRVKKLAEQIRVEQANLTKRKADLASTVTKNDVAMMALELRDRYLYFSDSETWTTEGRKTALAQTVERITLKGGSLEFVMKGGLILQKLSDAEVSSIHIENTIEMNPGWHDDLKTQARRLIRTEEKRRATPGRGFAKIPTRKDTGSCHKRDLSLNPECRFSRATARSTAMRTPYKSECSQVKRGRMMPPCGRRTVPMMPNVRLRSRLY